MGARGGRPVRRIAYLTGGHLFEQSILAREPYARALDPVYLPELAAGALDAYHVAILGSRGDADVIAEQGPALLRWWRAGGDLVALDQPPIDWLPGAAFEPRETNFWWWRTPGADLPLESPGLGDPVLAGLEHDDVKWHYHGVYQPPGEARTLVATPDGGAVLYVDQRPGSGRLVVTTMDPDYHTGQGFIPKAERLLEHLVGWAARGPRQPGSAQV
jgi:hypothetical protein